MVELGRNNLNKTINLRHFYHKISFLFLVQQGKFTARVIQRELAMITNLMTPHNFKDVTKDDGSPFNVSTARVWFEVGDCVSVRPSRLTVGVGRTISSPATVTSST